VIYTVRHRTTYSYDGALSFARCVLRLTPQSSAFQTVFESEVSVTPAPTTRSSRTGPFGEETISVTIEAPHDELVIESHSRVEVRAATIDASDPGPAWELVRAESLETGDIGAESPASFIYPTARTPIVAEITDFARESFPASGGVAAGADQLMRRIHDQFAYDPTATDVTTPIAEAFAARRGVCQDFAHIMIAALRGLGLPAAYVSGYLRTIPPPGKPRLAGADATHAWVRVWCGADLGWIGFDPTNAIRSGEDHITLAVGRDYGDVAPVDSIMLTSREAKLKVEVDVIPDGEAMPDAGVVQSLFPDRARA
jgi:transglutaminase-like putative cysteine protease